MKFITLFEGFFFSIFYSLGPFLAHDLLRKPFYGSLELESLAVRETRYGLLFCMAFGLFLLYTRTGYRTRYVLWHLERRRYGSGFTPLETAAVVFYHTIFLGLGSEACMFFLIQPHDSPGAGLWFLFLQNRIKNIFFLSVLQHSFLELSGFNDKIRHDYFVSERD